MAFQVGDKVRYRSNGPDDIWGQVTLTHDEQGANHDAFYGTGHKGDLGMFYPEDLTLLTSSDDAHSLPDCLMALELSDLIENDRVGDPWSDEYYNVYIPDWLRAQAITRLRALVNA